MVVDERVNVVESNLRRVVPLPVLAAAGTPSAAVGDPAELLDVHVHHLVGVLAFVARRGGLRRADHLTG